MFTNAGDIRRLRYFKNKVFRFIPIVDPAKLNIPYQCAHQRIERTLTQFFVPSKIKIRNGFFQVVHGVIDRLNILPFIIRWIVIGVAFFENSAINGNGMGILATPRIAAAQTGEFVNLVFRNAVHPYTGEC